MTTQTYYSPFFPPMEDAGASGTTIAVVPSEVVTVINTQLGDLSDRIDNLDGGGGGDVIPPDVVTGLTLTSGLAFDTDGTQVITLSAAWDASTATDIGYYVIALQEQGGGFVEFIVKGTSYNWRVRANRSFGAKVRAVDKFNNPSNYSSVVTTNSARDLVPPGLPTNLTISSSLSTFFLAFTPPVDADLDVIEIWTNSVNVLGSATKVSEVKGGSATLGDQMNTTKYFWLRARDTSGNVSGFTASVGATTGTVSSGSIDTTPPANPATPDPLVSAALVQPDNTQIIRLRATWTANTDSDLSSYEVELEEAGNSLGVYTTATNSIYFQVRGNVSYRVRIRALDKVSNRSAWSAWTAPHVSFKDTGAPGFAFTLEVIPAFSTFRLAWINPSDSDLAKAEVWESNSSDVGQAIKLDTVLAIPNSKGAFTVSGMPPATTKYYWIVTVDTSGNKSGFGGSVSGTTPRIGTTDITPGGITTPLITVGTLNGDRISTATLSADKLFVSGNATANQLPAGIFVGTSGTTIGVVQQIASDPAARINTVGTTIDPGKILISGGVRLSDWRNGDDNTKIEGGNIAANTITANKLTIGNRGVTAAGFSFQANAATNTVSWTAGTIFYTNDAGAPTYNTPGGGSVYCAPGDYQYIYWIKGSEALSASRFFSDALAPNAVHIATYQGGNIVIANAGGTIIDGARITTGTIDAVQIKANAIQTYHISTGTLNADRLQAGTITGDKFNTGTSLPGTITIGQTGVSIGTTQQSAFAALAGVQFADTRNDNQPPSYYYAQYQSGGPRTFADFKASAAIGIPFGAYCQMITTTQWSDVSGGPVHQEVRDSSGRYWNRASISPTTWGPWYDTGAQVNASTTQIDPGRILISGATTLASWRNGGDNTKIEGGNLAANTVTANKLKIGNRNLNVQDFNFRAVPSQNRVVWDAGYITYIGDDGAPTGRLVNAGSATFTNSYVYLFWVKDSNVISVGTNTQAIGEDNVPIAIYQGGSYLIVNYGGTTIDGDRITTGSITAAQVLVGSLTGDRITANTLSGDRIIANTLTGDKIMANTLSADKITVGTITTDRLVDNSVTKTKVMASTSQFNSGGFQDIYGGSASGGGGGGTVGGGGTGSGGGGFDNCVVVTNLLSTGGLAAFAKAGNDLHMLLEDDSGYYTGSIEAIRYGFEECYEIETESGILLEVSHSTPITSKSGIVHKVVNAVGVLVPVLDKGEFRWEAITNVTPIGVQPVAMISANNGVYAAGKNVDRYIFTHNIQYKP